MVETERKFTLLLVDDNPTNLKLLAKIIELDLPEVRVLTARGALEGLDLAEREWIDGAFIDVQMPQMSGLDMCRKLRLNPRTAEIPLVLITAHLASPEMRAEGLAVGAYDFISQPISNVEMLARIKVMLRLCESDRRSARNNRQLQQQLEDHSLRLRWVSGLLLSGNGPLEEPDQLLLKHLAGALPDPVGMDEQLFFEKLVTEFPLPWRRTLLKLALLDSIPLPLARKLSEIADITAVIDYLHRHQLSLMQRRDKEDYLVFSPQVRDLLRLRAAQDLDDPDRHQVYSTAAEWFREQGDFSAVLGCLIPAKQYPAVSQLLSQVGLILLDNNYRSRVLPLVDRIPDDVAAGCGWLSLFRGLNCLQDQSTDADVWLELAYQLFRAGDDARGELLTLAQQVIQTVYLDGYFERWLKRLDLFRALAEEQLASLEAVERLRISYALGLAELFFPGRLERVDRIVTDALAEAQQLGLAEQQQELNLLRALLALHQGRFLVARTALEQGFALVADRDCQLTNGVLQVIACELLHAAGDLSGFRKQQQVLTTYCSRDAQQRTVFAALLGYYAAGLLLAHGQMQRASEVLDLALLDGQAAKHAHLQSRLLQLRGWVKALSGQRAEALEDLEAGLEMRRQAGGNLCRLENLLFAATTCIALREFERAAAYLVEGLNKSLEHKEERFRAGLHAWMAVVMQKAGNAEAVSEHVRHFFELLGRHRATFFWGLVPELLEQMTTLISQRSQLVLLQPLLEKYLLCAFDERGRQIPLLSVHCLGRFQLCLEEQDFDLSQVGQASRQILTFLIVAPNHSLSIELIMGLLWPESPPNKARNNFDAAHSRLRKALEGCFGERIRQDYLVLEKGMLTLCHAQIDSRLFFEVMNMARYHMQRENFWQAEQVLWKMDRLWNGEFLSGYDLDGDLSLQREQLTQLRLEQLGILAQLLQRRRQETEAGKLLQQGLLLDSTQDAMVRQLLSLYQAQQDHRSAGLLLENYRTALQNEDYAAEEIEELMEALGAQWLTLYHNIKRREEGHGKL